MAQHFTKEHIAVCSKCINDCEKTIDECQKLIDMCSIKSIIECGREIGHVSDQANICIASSTACIKQCEVHSLDCTEANCLKMIRNCIEKCEICIKVCNDLILHCKSRDEQCVKMALNCIKACDDCAKACKFCLNQQ